MSKYATVPTRAPNLLLKVRTDPAVQHRVIADHLIILTPDAPTRAQSSDSRLILRGKIAHTFDTFGPWVGPPYNPLKASERKCAHI